MDVKLYVGNLAFTTTVDDLRILFAQAGMASQTDAAKAIGMFNEFTMQEREMKVNTAKAREERVGGPGGNSNKPGAFNPHKHRPRGGNRRY